MTWKPWKTYCAEPERLPIEEPPCKHCSHWNPVREFARLEFMGVRCCQADEMFHDFSCFNPAEDGGEAVA